MHKKALAQKKFQSSKITETKTNIKNKLGRKYNTNVSKKETKNGNKC